MVNVRGFVSVPTVSNCIGKTDAEVWYLASAAAVNKTVS